MSWTNKYWQIVNGLYWVPSYLGLTSIPKKYWKVDGDTVSIPKEMTNPVGPLYRRTRSGEEYWQFVRRQEETFNHIFDLTFSILPGDVVSDLFGQFVSAGFGHNYDAYDGDLGQEYFHGNQVTAPDGFFLARDSILAVELKFNAKTSLDQLAKYMLLFAREEQRNGERKHLDLLYVFNSRPLEKFAAQTGIEAKDVGSDLMDKLIEAVKADGARKLLQENQQAVQRVLERVNIHCISWNDLRDAVMMFSSMLQQDQGDRTLAALLNGFAAEIAAHPLSNVKAD
jgi:hypothetical protein